MSSYDQWVNRLCYELANAALASLTDKEILERCPHDYGAEPTVEHREYLWGQFFQHAEALDPLDLWDAYHRFVINKEELRVREPNFRIISIGEFFKLLGDGENESNDN
jgi:hypothetical protein